MQVIFVSASLISIKIKGTDPEKVFSAGKMFTCWSDIVIWHCDVSKCKLAIRMHLVFQFQEVLNHYYKMSGNIL